MKAIVLEEQVVNICTEIRATSAVILLAEVDAFEEIAAPLLTKFHLKQPSLKCA